LCFPRSEAEEELGDLDSFCFLDLLLLRTCDDLERPSAPIGAKVYIYIYIKKYMMKYQLIVKFIGIDTKGRKEEEKTRPWKLRRA